MTFYTPERITQERSQRDETNRGRLLIASCRSGDYLANKVVKRYEQLLVKANTDGSISRLENIDFQFSDTETCVRLEHDVSGHDVFLFQALLNPKSETSIDQNYTAFLIAARAFREWGARHITGVLPYLAYARQDKPTRFTREPTTAKLMADLSIKAGIDRLITWDPHTASIQGFYEHVPVEKLESMTMFTNAYRGLEGREEVILVASDAGASKLVTHLGRVLDLNSAIASKHRPEPEEAVISEVIGDFSGKQIAIVLDDMISSGGTVDGVIKKLVTEKGISEVRLGVSHNLGLDIAKARLINLHQEYGLKEVLVTNSVPQKGDFRQLSFVKIYDLADVLSRVINRIHFNRPVSELFYREEQP